ncbi:hypothetical protein V6N13_098446 [Hibiscus sabdariffa]|uniref:Pentatricopeptide repeat-containing protein n=1 Tax=Hibiscus sabdariffa TaxID=183260 RepID=A0ABR2EDU1_9ROSI
MESSQARGVFTKLMKILTLKPHLPISRASSSPCLLQTRRFSDIRRPIGEKEPVGFNSKGDDDGVPQRIPGTGRPLRDQRPSIPSSRETKGTNFDRKGSSFQLASDPEKKSEDSQSDVNFLEKFKLGLDNKREKLPSESEAINRKDHEEKVSPPQDADEIFKKMEETGLNPNPVARLDGLCEDDLIQLVELISENPSVIYAAVVGGSVKPIELDDALRILREKRSKGVVCDAFDFTVMIRGLYECNHLDDAIAFCLEMLDAGHSPNVDTFVCLVEGLCKEKGVEEAENFVGTLKQKGFLVDDEAVRQFLDKKAPSSPLVSEAIFGKKASQKTF